MFLILKVMAERSGTRFHTPAMSGSRSSVSSVGHRSRTLFQSSSGPIPAGSKYSSIRLIKPSGLTLITMQTRNEIDCPACPVACKMCC